MQNIQIFKYNDTPMEFEVIDGEVFANATIMCQAFGKRPADWVRLPQTERYLTALKSKCENLTLIESVQGGQNPRTRIHEKLILKLAQWLDVDFEVWCDEKLAELLRTGKVETAQPKTQAELFLQSAQMLVEQERRLNEFEAKQSEQDERILQIEAKNATSPDYFTIMGYAILKKKKVNVTLAAEIGRKSSAICKLKGYPVEKVKDPRFGFVGSYPTEVLQTVFSAMSFT